MHAQEDEDDHRRDDEGEASVMTNVFLRGKIVGRSRPPSLTKRAILNVPRPHVSISPRRRVRGSASRDDPAVRGLSRQRHGLRAAGFDDEVVLEEYHRIADRVVYPCP